MQDQCSYSHAGPLVCALKAGGEAASRGLYVCAMKGGGEPARRGPYGVCAMKAGGEAASRGQYEPRKVIIHTSIHTYTQFACHPECPAVTIGY